MIISNQNSNRAFNTINLKNQRQTVVDSITDRNKNSLLGMTRGQVQAMPANISQAMVNQSTLD